MFSRWVKAQVHFAVALGALVAAGVVLMLYVMALVWAGSVFMLLLFWIVKEVLG